VQALEVRVHGMSESAAARYQELCNWMTRPAPWRPARCHDVRPAVAERGAGATRRRRGGEKGLYFSYPLSTLR
jgi:hypothetical protein